MARHARAPIVDIRRVKDSATFVNYVTKYVGKDPHRFEGCKRYWSSQDYEQRDDEDGSPPRRRDEPYWVVFKDWSNYLIEAGERGFVIEYADGGAYLTYQPWWEP